MNIDAKDYRAALQRVKDVLPDCGFYPGGDHGPGDAECHAIDKAMNTDQMLRNLWPWNRSWWKPKDRRRNLVRAGALIVAEIERIDRAAANTQPQT